MKFYTYDDFLLWKKYFYATIPCGVAEDSAHYTPQYTDKELEEIQINNEHDKSYRDLLNNKTEFSIFLKNFLNYDVPACKLEKYNNAFITNDFKNRRSDIVFKLKDEPVYIFVEHQSTKDESVHYRIFEYYSLILRDTVDKDKLKNKNYKFPIIVPILLYTGQDKWKFVPNIQEKQANSYLFMHRKLNFPYDFITIHDYETRELLNSNSTVAYIMATDKCNSKSDLYNILNNLSQIDLSNSQRKTIQRFIFYIFDKYFSKDVKIDLINKFNERIGDDMNCAWVNLIEDLRRDRAEGVAEGIAEGKRTGKLEGIMEIINNMLKNGESTEKISSYTGFSKKKIESMRRELKLTVK